MLLSRTIVHGACHSSHALEGSPQAVMSMNMWTAYKWMSYSAQLPKPQFLFSIKLEFILVHHEGSKNIPERSTFSFSQHAFLACVHRWCSATLAQDFIDGSCIIFRHGRKSVDLLRTWQGSNCFCPFIIVPRNLLFSRGLVLTPPAWLFLVSLSSMSTPCRSCFNVFRFYIRFELAFSVIRCYGSCQQSSPQVSVLHKMKKAHRSEHDTMC